MTFLGHPRGLATLFFTEYWERFSYYGMRALLILFMTAPASDGGLEFDVPKAAAIYGVYTASVYLAALPAARERFRNAVSRTRGDEESPACRRRSWPARRRINAGSGTG